MDDLAEILAREAGAVVEAGIDIVQLDDPALTYFCDRRLMSGLGTHDERLRREWDVDRQFPQALAAISPMWRLRNAPHVGEGVLPPRVIYLATVDSATEYPSKCSSDWIRGAPQVGFSRDMRRMRERTSSSAFGRPAFPCRDFQRRYEPVEYPDFSRPDYERCKIQARIRPHHSRFSATFTTAGFTVDDSSRFSDRLLRRPAVAHLAFLTRCQPCSGERISQAAQPEGSKPM